MINSSEFSLVVHPDVRWVYFAGEGRLGNQVIQYLFIRKIFPNAVILTFNLGALFRFFNGVPNLRNISLPKNLERIHRKFIFKILYNLLGRFSKLCYSVAEMQYAKGATGIPLVHPGILPIAIVNGGYYQNFSDILSINDFKSLRLDDFRLGKTLECLDNNLYRRGGKKIIVHVRRTDYIGYTTYGVTDVVLPVDYYKKAVLLAKKIVGEDSQLIVVTDDRHWCSENLVSLGTYTVVSGDEVSDFYTLAVADVIVISNSTYSLGAACVSPSVAKIIAPEYWFGFRSADWLPPRIKLNEEKVLYV